MILKTCDACQHYNLETGICRQLDEKRALDCDTKCELWELSEDLKEYVEEWD